MQLIIAMPYTNQICGISCHLYTKKNLNDCIKFYYLCTCMIIHIYKKERKKKTKTTGWIRTNEEPENMVIRRGAIVRKDKTSVYHKYLQLESSLVCRLYHFKHHNVKKMMNGCFVNRYSNIEVLWEWDIWNVDSLRKVIETDTGE